MTTRLLLAKRYLVSSYISKGERDLALSCVNLYAFIRLGLRHDHEEERKQFLISWLSDRRGYTRCAEEKHEIIEAVERAVQWRPNRDFFSFSLSDQLIERMVSAKKSIGCFIQANINRMQEARTKILDALSLLLKQGQRITIRAIARISGCSHHTINKHRELLPSVAGRITQVDHRDPVASEITSLKAHIDLNKKKKEETTCVSANENTPSAGMVTAARGEVACVIKHMAESHECRESSLTSEVHHEREIHGLEARHARRETTGKPILKIWLLSGKKRKRETASRDAHRVTKTTCGITPWTMGATTARTSRAAQSTHTKNVHDGESARPPRIKAATAFGARRRRLVQSKQISDTALKEYRTCTTHPP